MENEQGRLPLHGTTIIEMLKHDHQVIARLLGDLVEAKTTEVRGSALVSLRAALVIHNSTEELFAYPALARFAHKKAESQHLYHDTAAANVLMFALQVSLQNGDELEFDRIARALEAAVREHAANEEASAFEDMQERLDVRQLEMLTSSVREFRGSFHFYATPEPAEAFSSA